MLDCRRWFVVVWSLGVGSCPAGSWLCDVVAVVWLQRCARPTASVARILHRLTRPVLCLVPVRCAPLLPTASGRRGRLCGWCVRDWWPWFGCHRRGSLPGAGVKIPIGAAALSMWNCGRWFVVVWSLGVGSCPAGSWLCDVVAVVWLQRCARPTANVARILHRLTRPVLCRVPVRCAPLLPTASGRRGWFVVGVSGIGGRWCGCHRRGSLPGAVWKFPSARLLSRCGIVATGSWWCGRWVSVRVRLVRCCVMWSPWLVRGRCGLVAVVWLQRCARPTASVARILHRLTRPVLCPARCRWPL